MALIYLSIALTPAEQRKMQERVTTDWLLYGELHVTNAPRGTGITFLDPKRIRYDAPRPDSSVGERPPRKR